MKESKISQFFKKAKLNIKPIIKTGMVISSYLLSFAGTLFLFIEWKDIHIEKLWIRITILLCMILLPFIISFFLIVGVLKNKKLWANGNNKVLAYYGDIFKHAKKTGKKIVMIPVNDTFETIVDDDLSIDRPLVSPNTLHGKWIKLMEEKGINPSKLNDLIQTSLSGHLYKPVKTYSEKEKPRGNRKSYPLGSVATINTDNETTYYLVAISKFDTNNRASSSRKIIRNCIDDLVEFYDNNGQGYPIYIPLFGTDRSRADLTHQQAFRMIKSAILTDEKSINGIINIVVFEKDKDKVSIFK